MGTVAREQDRIDFDRLFQAETCQALAAEIITPNVQVKSPSAACAFHIE